MNEFKNSPIEKTIQKVAEDVQPNMMFTAELEAKLRQAHKPRKTFSFSLRGFAPVLTSLVALGALTFFMVWIFNTVDLQPTPGNDFACPVTQPNGSLPPGETVNSPYHLGNGELWTSLWPDGKVYMELHNQEADGAFAMKWGFVRAVTGPLTIEGHRLDAEAEPLRAFITDGYGDTGLQVTSLIFPTTGCWEVTARVGESSLTFVTEVVFNEDMPTPEATMLLTTNETFEYEVQEGDTCSMLADRHGISVEELMELNGLNECTIFVGMKLRLPVTDSVTPPPQEGGYDWRGITLYLDATLPETSSDVTIYQAQAEIPATVDDARAFAQRFNLTGEIYQVPGEMPNTTNYLIVDGNRQLRLRSDGYFTYILDQTAWSNSPIFVRYENGETIIAEFMQTYGFDSTYTIEYSESYSGYFVTPLTPDGSSVWLGYFNANGLLFRFNNNGLLAVEASLLRYDEVINASIISAEEALQRVLSENTTYGINEGMRSGGSVNVQAWSRQRTLDEPVTYFGWLKSTGASIDGNAPLITLDGYTVTGNTADIAPNTENIFIEAVGSFHEENGFKTFAMESWKVYEGYEEGLQGRVEREGDQVSITVVEGPKLLLPDFPADIPLPVDHLYIIGVTRGDVFEWKTIDTRTQNGGGGGGGGGGGFYKINVSGVPVPIPPTATPTPEAEFSQQPIEALRGIVSVTIYVQEDGTKRTEYLFIASQGFTEYPYMTLEGDGLDELKAYHNRPIEIWGSVDRINENGLPVAKVERFEIPFPDLAPEVLQGKTSFITVNGEELLVFVTEDSQSYVLIYSDGSAMMDSGMPLDTLLNVEGLAIPGETYGGYPALRMFGMGIALNPDTGEEFDYIPSASTPNEVPDFSAAPNTTVTATIEQVDLIYYTPNPRYTVENPDPLYIQPVWRFIGHYSNGDEFEILVQALTDEFLLPEYEDVPPLG